MIIHRTIEANRLALLKELFYLTKDSEDVMKFLSQRLPENEDDPFLTEEELKQQKEFLQKHQLR